MQLSDHTHMNRVADQTAFRLLRRRPWLVICVALAACGGGDDLPEPVPPQPSFTSLGSLPGYTGSQAVAVSSDGRVVAGNAGTPVRNSQAFRWTAEAGMVALGFMPGGTYSNADAITANGSVVLAYGDTTAQPPTYSGLFLWSANTGPVQLQSPPNAIACDAGGISGDATVVSGTCIGPGPNMAYRWTGTAAPVALGRFGGGSGATSNATAVSKDSRTIVGFGHPFLAGAILWESSGTTTMVGKLAGDSAGYGTAVNRDGSAVVGYSVDSDQVGRGFRWTLAHGIQSLGAAPTGVIATYASGVSGDGQRIVGWGTTAGEDVALSWDSAHGWRALTRVMWDDYRLEVPGWALHRAMAISDDGLAIVGYGTNPRGQTEAWLVRLRE